MKKIIEWILMNCLRAVLWFRYKIRVEGLEKLDANTLDPDKGILFLPNHPSYFIDPVLVPVIMRNKHPIRPMIVEYMYYLPFVNWVMRFLNALPVPNFHSSSNSLKKKKTDQVFEEVAKGLLKKENFLIYPAGKVKHTQKEVIGGASGIHRLVQEVPEANIVLVRIKGLWGSSFSRAICTEAPSLPGKILWGLKIILKNLIFFTPRRTITVAFEPAPADFPRNATRLELNKYLENWYNLPDGLSEPKESHPGDTLTLVSYSMWGKQLLPLHTQSQQDQGLDAVQVPSEIKQVIYKKIAQISGVDVNTITPEMSLDIDLGLDSIDQAEIASFIQDEFEVDAVPLNQLTSVKKLLVIATNKAGLRDDVDEQEENLARWKKKRPHELAEMPEGETIHEVFLRTCDKMGKAVACADEMSGIVTYQQLKLRTVLVADYLRKQPGQYIGILLPASVGANALILACLLAGKVPVLINWTTGPRHLEAVVKFSGIQKVLTSWAFLDRLDNVNLAGVEDLLVMMEDVRREFKLTDKIKAFYRSHLSTNRLLKIFDAPRSSEEQAVLLFTSGTESLPKGVPLSHKNILSNQRGALKVVELYQDDVMFGILPPFHAFGFTISGLMALLLGIRVAFSPNPTDGKKLAKGIQKWGVTLLCGAPTFLKAIARVAQKDQLKTLRLCVSGAEKAPPELFELFAQHDKKEIVLEGYGITECSPVLTFTPFGKIPKGVGKPIPGVELCIVHPETFEVLAPGERGLILAKGPNIFKGYLNPGISSPFATVNGEEWYKTGDLGYIDPEDGYLIIAGRQKRFIKVGGEMVSLSAIEETVLNAVLSSRSVVQEAGPLVAVCAKEIPGEKPKIYLVSRVTLGLDEVNGWLRAAGFSNLVKIFQVTILEEIPIMGSGKINYRLLESDYLPK